MKIEKNANKNFKFSLSLVTRDEIEKEIKLLDTSKSQPFNDNPTIIYKDNHDIFSNFTTCLTVSSCHVTYAFQSESTLYICLNVKELLA